MDVFRPAVSYAPITLSFEGMSEVHALRRVLREALVRLGASAPANAARERAKAIESDILANSAMNQFNLFLTSEAQTQEFRTAVSSVLVKSEDAALAAFATTIYNALADAIKFPAASEYETSRILA